MFPTGLKMMTAWVRLDINMKKIIAFLLVFSCLLCTGCDKKAEETQAGFLDKNTGIEYVYCKFNGIRANARGDEYAKSDVRTYYKVPFENPEKFLCVDLDGELILLRAKDVAEPELSGFDPVAGAIYDGNDKILISRIYVDEEYLSSAPTEDYKGETSICKSIADALTKGEDVGYPSNVNQDETYNIRLFSQKYPGLYYGVVFTSAVGRYYLTDRATGKTVYAPDDVKLRMVG